jgi:hypothetical protein
MPTKYKNCPHCGSDKIEYNNDTGPDDGGFWEWVECKECGARCPDAETWNRRTATKESNTQGDKACPSCRGEKVFYSASKRCYELCGGCGGTGNY